MQNNKVAILTLGCARNEVDSEEVAGRLAGDGWQLVPEAEQADVVVVNTCGFIDSAKQESIEVLLAAADRPGPAPKVVAIGCLAQRYGRDLAEELPEAASVLGFDDYPEISARLSEALQGRARVAHEPADRRLALPVTPVLRPAAAGSLPGHATGTPGWHWSRRRLSSGPVAACKIASGCDRRCAFCAIPAIRGLFVSRPVVEIVAEAQWLVDQGVRELVLVSENSTSYGKDLGGVDLAGLLTELDRVPGLARIRVSYLQPAEVRPALVQAMADLPSVVDYFDLSFQHASEGLLRRMRRFGSRPQFLDLLGQIRALRPMAGVRSNFIVGFPGETERDVNELVEFLSSADLDAIGLFGYSDEEGTEAVNLPGKLPQDEVDARLAEVSDLAEELMSQRADARIGDTLAVLVESVSGSIATGRAEHQGPDDGATSLHLDPGTRTEVRVGEVHIARVVAAEGVDLVAVGVDDPRLGHPWGAGLPGAVAGQS